MRKSTIFIALAVVVLLVVGSAVWLSLSNPSNTANNGGTSTPSESAVPSSNTTDATNETEVKISIRDMAFSPSAVKIKKGTTVTWTNNDTVGHNVVADSASSSGGLPMSQALFAQGETFSHTFATVGTFAYHCMPHPFMKGTIEVVE